MFYFNVGPRGGAGTVWKVDPDVGGQWVPGLPGLDSVEGLLGDKVPEDSVRLHL